MSWGWSKAPPEKLTMPMALNDKTRCKLILSLVLSQRRPAGDQSLFTPDASLLLSLSLAFSLSVFLAFSFSGHFYSVLYRPLFLISSAFYSRCGVSLFFSVASRLLLCQAKKLKDQLMEECEAVCTAENDKLRTQENITEEILKAEHRLELAKTKAVRYTT